MFSLPIALALALIAIAIGLRLGAGTWLHPAPFFAGWWSLAATLPLIVAREEPVSAGAMLWVLAATVAVALGAIAGNRGLVTHRLAKPPEVRQLEVTLLAWPMVVAIVLGMLSSVVFAALSGVSLGDIRDIQSLVVVSNRLYVSRVADIANPVAPPRLSQALLPFVFLAPAHGGMVFVLKRDLKWKIVAASSILPAMAVTVLQTTKAAVLFSATLWIASYFTLRLRFGMLKVVTRGHLIFAAIVGAAGMALFFATSIARMGSTDASLAALVRVKLITAAFGHMSVFSHWLSDYWSQSFDPTLGTYVLAGPLELLGFEQRKVGIFENVVELIAGETSNIYTGFRPLIEDFTMPGAIAVLGALGLAAGAAYRAVGRSKWSAIPVLVGAYMTILWTPLTWLWVYNSLTATLLAVVVIVFVVRLWRGTLRYNPRVRTSAAGS